MPHREGRPAVIVWLEEERVFGEVTGPFGAYFTMVKYTKGGIEYEVLMENEEFTLLEDLNEYDSD